MYATGGVSIGPNDVSMAAVPTNDTSKAMHVHILYSAILLSFHYLSLLNSRQQAVVVVP